MGRMHLRGSKLIQDQRILDQANYYLNHYKGNMTWYWRR